MNIAEQLQSELNFNKIVSQLQREFGQGKTTVFISSNLATNNTQRLRDEGFQVNNDGEWRNNLCKSSLVMKTKIEILSWHKSKSECGFRLNLINHIDVFVHQNGTSYVIDEKQKELYLKIIEYSDKYDYSQNPSVLIGKDEKHIQKCEIIGNKEALRFFQKVIGYSSIGNDASESQRTDDLIEAVDNLSHYMLMLQYELQERKNENTN